MSEAVVEPIVPNARQRILTCAYDLFVHRGIRAVSVDEIIAKSGVAKATLYRHFRTKDELVLSFLAQREQLWTLGFVAFEAKRRGVRPEDRLLGIFDAFDEWFQRDDFEACSFINVLLEMGSEHPAGKACIDYLANIRAIVIELGEEAGLQDVDSFARSWHILMKGSIISAAEGDRESARRGKAMAVELIDRHRQS